MTTVNQIPHDAGSYTDTGGLNQSRYKPHDRIRLTRWPDFKKLNYQPLHVRIVVMLNKGQHNVAALCDKTNLPEDDVGQFLDQCHELGYLEITRDSTFNAAAILAPHQTVAPQLSTSNAAQERRPTSPSKSNSLFMSIRKRLGIR